MAEVFLVDGLRTPFGALGGSLAGVPAPALAAGVIKGLLARQGLAPEQIDEVIIGQVLQGGAGQAPARQAMRQAGLPDATAALTINKVCGSGLKAVMLAAGSILLGDARVAIAGGMENMSRAPYALFQTRYGQRLGNGEVVDLLLHDALRDPESGRAMGELTEGWIAAHGVSRQAQDEYALESYGRARQAMSQGILAEEILPVVIPGKKGDTVVAEDEEPGKADLAKLPQLKPVFSAAGSITAGNASSIDDGAALLLLAGEAALEDLQLTPMARIVAAASYGLAPDLFAEAPVGAIRKVLQRAGLTVADMDLFEINEAFAAVPLVAMAQLGLDGSRVNVNGGAVSLGHPVGASGGRLALTLGKEMQRRKVRYGLATLCIGGGEAVAVILERV